MLPPAPGVRVVPGPAVVLAAAGERIRGDRARIDEVDLRGRDGLGLLLRPAKRAGLFHVGAVFRRERTELIRASADGNQADHGSEPQ